MYDETLGSFALIQWDTEDSFLLPLRSEVTSQLSQIGLSISEDDRLFESNAYCTRFLLSIYIV